jgi:membrane protein
MSLLHSIGRAAKKIAYGVYRCAYDAIVLHDGIEHAGYLAYLSMLALFPFLVLLVMVLGSLGEGDIGVQLIERILQELPPEAVSALTPRIEEISAGPPEGLVTLSVIGAIWTASSAVEGLRTVLNRAYRVSTPPAYIWRRLMSIAQLLIFTAVIICGLLILVFAPIIQYKLELMLGIPLHDAEAFKFTDIIFSFSAFTLFLMVANLYFILPNIKQRLRYVIPGALVTVGLWLLAARGYSYYLSTFDQVNLIYGSLAGIIASLIFFFLVNLCFIFGAEFNYQMAIAFGTYFEEKEHVD